MDFVLVLHSHLPYVLHHGRWPHGSSWLCEAALDTYLPLIECLDGLTAHGIAVPLTLGITPVLANQLMHPSFATELEHFAAERRRALDITPGELERDGQHHLLPIVDFWRQRQARTDRLLDRIGGDIGGAFRRLSQSAGIELMGGAATHGYLPLLATDESVRLQLQVGYDEHRRVFGTAPRGCWLPECGYRPPGERAGLETHLDAVGFRYFVTDAHLAGAGTPLSIYRDVPLGTERFDADRRRPSEGTSTAGVRSPYYAYRLRGDADMHVFVRDPTSSLQVWSREYGYPGDQWYLEFHKMRWPGGLKLWRVSGPGVDLGDKQPYEPATARGRALEHGRHFVAMLEETARERAGAGPVITAPFDTELFGHWWFEAFDFLTDVFRRLATSERITPTTAADHLQRHRGAPTLSLHEGSWGIGGDHRTWLNDGTRWTWDRLWPLERRFWSLAPAARASSLRPVLAQAARSLLLAQSSDWQFIMSTGVAADYAERRFTQHADDLAALLDGLEPDANDDGRLHALALADGLRERDDVFPAILDSLDTV